MRIRSRFDRPPRAKLGLTAFGSHARSTRWHFFADFDDSIPVTPKPQRHSSNTDVRSHPRPRRALALTLSDADPPLHFGIIFQNPPSSGLPCLQPERRNSSSV